MKSNIKNKIKSLKHKNMRKFFIVSGIVSFVLFSILMTVVISGLPPLEELENPKLLGASQVFDCNNQVIGTFSIERRIEIKFDTLPKHLIDALVATEDRKFYSHWGVDLNRFAKAMVKNVFFFSREGASTLTQQLAKNLYKLKGQDENVFSIGLRKLREWITAVQIEKTYTKNEILELYLNTSYFGRRSYGVESASLTYFNKSAHDLSIDESAVLVALLKSSVIYDPIRKPENALMRRNLVLSQMVEAGFLSHADFENLKKKKIPIEKEKATRERNTASYFLEYIKLQLAEFLDRKGIDLYQDGLKIYSTLDLRMQKIADSVVAEHLKTSQVTFNQEWSWEGKEAIINGVVDRAIRNSNEFNNAKTDEQRDQILTRLKSKKKFIDSIKTEESKIQTAFIVIEPGTGNIKVMVGGRDQDFQFGLNHTTQAKRQPGSSFKPFVYATAIERGKYPQYILLNQRFTYKGWSPQNAPPVYTGNMSLRQGLTYSVNVIAARLTTSDDAPPDQVVIVAEKLGVKASKLNPYPALALGALEVTPIEMASGYATLADNGVYHEPLAITKIENKDGVLLERFESVGVRAISAESAAMVVSMMQDVITYGTGSAVRYYFPDRPAAGKTGTTQDYADAWFVGFTPQLAAAVWVGFDDRRIRFSSAYGFGASAALPIWGQFFKKTYEKLKLPIAYFNIPADVISTDFCAQSYGEGGLKLASNECSDRVSDLVNKNQMPPRCSGLHVGPKRKTSKNSHNGGSGW